MAQDIHDKCGADARAAGYLPLGEVGAIGVLPSTEASSQIRILKVVPGSPAALAGMKAGDAILAVDDQPTTNAADARQLFFGRINTPVKVTYRSAGIDKSVTLIRYPATKMQAELQK